MRINKGRERYYKDKEINTEGGKRGGGVRL